MATSTLHATCTARPVRLAFLLEKPDPPALLDQIFRLNTLLWGGIGNPILVLDGSTRIKAGVQETLSEIPYEQELLRLLRDFDPDFLINYTDGTLHNTLAPFKNRTFPRDKLRWNPWGMKEVMFFLEIWPFLREYWRKEFRFEERPRQTVGFIDLANTNEYKTYLIARFGSYPEESTGNEILSKYFDAKAVTYDKSFREAFVLGDWIFPIAISALQLDIPFPGAVHNFLFFLLDPTNSFDIVDYWNLRAAGSRVFPLPVGQYQDFAEGVKGFAARATYPINPQVMNYPTLVKAGSVADDLLREVGKWISGLGVKESRLQGWVPHFGERGYRIAPELQVRQMSAKRSSEVVVISEGSGVIRGPFPECEFSDDAKSQHWAMDLELFIAGDNEHTFRLPWLHPQCDMVANRAVGHGYELTASRVSKDGIVAIRTGDREHVWIRPPRVVDAFRAYLEDSGITYVGTSSTGLALERIIEQVGGLWHCRILQHKGVREILRHLAFGAHMHASTIQQILSRASLLPKEEKKITVSGTLGKLVETRILRQGIELQCKRCQRHEWYHLSDLGDEFKCKKCFHVQQVPSLAKHSWSYISDGLFRLGKDLQGCITTILAILFLQDFLGLEMKYLPSFDYTYDDTQFERDFAILTTEFLQEDVDVILGECKTIQPLEEEEKQAIKELGVRTGAYLAFCTQSEDFRDSDKEFFRELVENGQKLILLSSKHIQMRFEDVSEYKREHFAPPRDCELLSRVTTIEVLGKEFTDKERIWI